MRTEKEMYDVPDNVPDDDVNHMFCERCGLCIDCKDCKCEEPL